VAVAVPPGLPGPDQDERRFLRFLDAMSESDSADGRFSWYPTARSGTGAE